MSGDALCLVWLELIAEPSLTRSQQAGAGLSQVDRSHQSDLSRPGPVSVDQGRSQ